MKAEDAINHFKWKYTQSDIKTSRKDKESLNAIIIALNQANELKLNDNLNFCKLFIYTFKKMCLTNAINNEYKEVDLKMIYDKLQMILNMDAKSHVNSLHDELKGIEIQKLISENSFNVDTFNNIIKQKEVNSNVRRMLSEFIDNY